MIFKFLNRPITITAFAPEIYKNQCIDHAIQPSSKFVPNWWKKTPKSEFNFTAFESKATAKSCLGIISTFQNGYVMPLWSDLAIQTRGDEWRYSFADRKSELNLHNAEQTPNFYENFFHFKLNAPWILKSSTEIKCCVQHPFYSFANPLPYIIPYGILPSLKKTTAANVFMFIEKKSNDILLNAGTPLLQFIPLTERPIIFKTEIIATGDWAKLNYLNPKYTFVGTGLKLMKKNGGR